MGDLISREAAVNKLRKWAKQTEGAKSDVAVGAFYESAARYLERLPAVDAEPVRHGYWLWRDELIYVIGEPIEHETGWECSVCHTKLESYIYETISESAEIDGYEPKMKYCPCCGAKMDADECTQIES